MSRPFTMIAAILLLAVAAAHVARIAMNVDVAVGPYQVPMNASIAGAVIAGLLGLLVLRESRR